MVGGDVIDAITKDSLKAVMIGDVLHVVRRPICVALYPSSLASTEQGRLHAALRELKRASSSGRVTRSHIL